jgi:hypothetical protein
VSPSARASAKCRRALLSAPPQSTVDPSHAARSTSCGPCPPNFPLEKKSGKMIFSAILHLNPFECCKSIRNPKQYWILSVRPSVSKKYLRLGPSHPKYPKIQPKIPQKFPHFTRVLSFASKPSNHSQNFRKNQEPSSKDRFAPKSF